MNGQAGRYRILDELGVGGMGAVYRAQDRAAGRIVAFKQLKSIAAGAKRRTIEALFEREYHTLVRLKHPRIIDVYDYGLTESGPYYTMELLDGKDLQQLAPLPFAEACSHLRDVASSLALLHAHRLVHRDVSPRNVRLTVDGRAKLIDFGALATFGAAAEIVGTPPCMAPEVLLRLPIDQRTDLFALGAIGYWALTGRHAYPARRAQELPGAWEHTPAPPSAFAADVPPALDALIMSLLSADPMARPASAAAVIDQLTAIAALEPEEHEQAAASYLSSGKLVGRGEEQAWLQQRLLRALRGKGSEVLLEGPSGIGKTRLLHEISLDAQLRGALALRADAQACAGAFGVAVALAGQLLTALPDAARELLGPDAGLLAHLSPELAARLELRAEGALPDDPAERRARFQTALHGWFTQVAARHTLLVAVDNLQAADDSSAAFLAALGHEAHHLRLMLLLTQTTFDEPAAEVPLRALRKRAARIKLAGLAASACEELVCSLFGNVPNTGRLAKLLYDKSAGNPQLCMDMAQLLVKRQIAKYVAGSWVLPLELAGEELPSGGEALVLAKLAGIGADARALCETLSIHDQRVSIERCSSLSEGMAEQAMYAALDELVAEHILVVEDGRYGFRQHVLRQFVLAQIDPARRRSLHLHAADALLADGAGRVSAQMEAAWHLLHAGEEVRGADLMALATREFLRHQGVENVEQVVRAIDTALSLYEKQRRSKHQIASMLFPLMSLAFFVDWRVTLKHGERAIELGLDITGLGLAQKLSRFLPDKLALGLGLGVAAVRFAVQRLRGLRFGLVEAIESFCGLVPASIGTQNIVFDLPALRRFVALLKPLKLFGKKHIASLMYDFAYSQYLMGFGKEKEATELLETLRLTFPDPRWKLKQVLGEAHWKAMYGGILFSLGIGYPYEFGSRALTIANEMEALGVRVWAMAAEEVRMLHHAMRGESEPVQRCRERVELFAVQGSTTWQADIFWPILLLDTEIRAGDAIAVRTIREQLTRRANDHPSLRVFADVAHCSYLTLRGEHRAAIAAFERLHEQLGELEPELAWPAFRASFALAAALNAAGEHERAKNYATESLRRAGADVERVVAHYLEPQRQLALAEAGRRERERARQQHDCLLAAPGGEDQPMLIGLLHKARAELAAASEDHPAFEHHLQAALRNFNASRNPSLIAQGARLSKRVERGHTGPSMPIRVPRPATNDSISVLTSRALSELSGVSERAELALRLVVKSSAASAGFLYVLRGERLELAAASSNEHPGPELEAKLSAEIEQVRSRALDDDGLTAAVDSPDDPRSVFIDSSVELTHEPGDGTGAEPAAVCAPRFLVLTSQHAGRPALVGGLIIEPSPDRPFTVDVELLDPIARALHESLGN